MSLDQLAAISQIVGTIAVIASLIFVGFQLNQQNDQLKANRLATIMSTESSGAGLGQNPSILLAGDPALLDIVRRAQKDPSSISLTERGQFSAYMMASIYHTQIGYLIYLKGASSDEFWKAHAGVTAPLFRNPGGLGWWERNRLLFLPDFRAWVDGLAGIGPLLPPGLPDGHPLLAPPPAAT